MSLYDTFKKQEASPQPLPPPEEKPKEGLFKRIIKAVLPKPLEKAFGIADLEPFPLAAPQRKAPSLYAGFLVQEASRVAPEAKRAPTDVLERPRRIAEIPAEIRAAPKGAKPISVVSPLERIKKWGESWEWWTTQKEQTKRQAEIDKVRKQIPADYKEPAGFWSQFREGLLEGTANVAASIGSGIEVAGKLGKAENVAELGKRMNVRFEKMLAGRPEWQAPTDLGKWKDKRFYARLVGGSIPSVLGGFATIIGTTLVTGNPLA